MRFADKKNNVYVIDTHMFGFQNYCACYIVAGKEVALVDTGLPNQFEAFQAGLRQHGFSISDISYVFITHGHTDHCGNVGPILKANPAVKVLVHADSAKRLTDPVADTNRMKGLLLPQMLSRFGEIEPVPVSHLTFLNDGDIFDLGDGVRLRVVFAPGHQPGGTVIFEEKNQGLFINDLVGAYLADADASLILTPFDSDVVKSMESLRKIQAIPVKTLFMGHYGIHDDPPKVISRALDGMQRLLDIGARCVVEGRPERIEPMITESKIPEAQKLLATRGKLFYDYIVDELIPHQSTYFSQYYLNRFLAQQQHGKMQDVIEQAVKEYKKKKFFEDLNAGYARLKEDPQSWAEDAAERKEWDATLRDGIEEDDGNQ
jgi:glyoxylase-like metal-dependent hydrolase (beta-lactamase superfamily II)